MNCGAVIVENRFDVTQICARHLMKLPMSWNVMHIPQEKIKTINDYNKFLTNKKFWEEIPFDKVLIFQHDSGLLREGIEEFLEYDFIGAPIFNIDFPAMNGGLSLRSKSAMIKCIEYKPWNTSLGNEDIFFCNILKEIGGNLPTKEVAQSFSVETIYGLGSLGYHAIEKYLTPEQVTKIKTQYDNI